MKKVFLGLAVAAVAGYVVWTKFQPPPQRLTTALADAKREDRLVLLDFTGSDWCGWCKKLEEDALGKPEFIDYSAKYLVTLVVDFPMHRELAGDLKEANQALKSKYDVTGYPTLVALSPDGKVVWQQVGYTPGGPFVLIDALNQARKALGMPAPAGTAPQAIATTPAIPSPGRLPGQTSPASAVAPPAKHGVPADAPRLQGVFYSRSNPSIILGGRQCREGDSVDGMRVVKILPDRVTVEWEGQTEELKMP